MSKQRNERVMESLKSSLKKDEIDLETEKIKFINEIKGIKKEELFPAPKKLSLWKKILKVMNF